MKALGINLIIATVWLLLSQKSTGAMFMVGFVLGFILLALFRRVLGSEDYVRRTLACLRFLLTFAREFLRANLKVAYAVLFRSRESMHADFVEYDCSDLTRGEILLLSYAISLTPGTTTVKVSDDFRTLIVHSLDAGDPDAVRAGIDRSLRQPMLAFTR